MANTSKKTRANTITPPAYEKQLARQTMLWLVAFTLILGYLIIRYVVLKMPVLPAFYLGSFKLNFFGPIMTMGILFGWHLTHHWCVRFGLDWPTLQRDLFAIIIIGFLVSHLGSIALYTPEKLFDIKKLVNIRSDMSSFSGFFGSTMTALYFLKKRRLAIRPYVDGLLYSFTGGWMFGRLACFAIHDHPGLLTALPTGVMMRGQLRHDLGFYELLLTIMLFAYLTWAVSKGRKFDGFVVATVAPSYAIGRFGLDFLRLGDATYGGLTPAQWACIPLLAIGIEALWHGRRR